MRWTVESRLSWVPLLLGWICVAQAQAQSQSPAGQAIADGATFGGVATLAPLCGLRDEAWSADLRRSALQAAHGGEGVAALGYGDMEVLEDFAADGPERSCAALRQNPALKRADGAVDAYRKRHDGKPVS